MQIKILAFGITKEILGGREFQFDFSEGMTVQDLKKSLGRQFPALEKINTLAIAVNGEYAAEYAAIHANDEVVLIPPVSGG